MDLVVKWDVVVKFLTHLSHSSGGPTTLTP